MRPLVCAVSAALLVTALAACSEDQPTPAPSGPSSASSPPEPTPSGATTSAAPSATTSAAPSGGTADDPVALEPRTELLDWRPESGPVRASVTRGGGWTLTVRADGNGYSLDGPSTSSGSAGSPGSGTRVSDALLDEHWAVVVHQDKAEQRPSVAEVTELATGKTFRVDGRSDVPTTNGGTWALGEGRLLHATIGPGATYCVASVDLATRRSTLGWCAPRRHGFNAARITPAGTSLLTFDDAQPSCRTVVALAGSEATPFAGVPECHGWDGLLTDHGAVWSVIPRESRIEDAHFYARSGDGYLDLGPGTAGSLTWCGGAAYFARDPRREGEPATLMRWSSADGLSVAYESPGGQAFLSEPRCGGDTITVTALAEDGDEQVSARVS
jgi:hypothetical protein